MEYSSFLINFSFLSVYVDPLIYIQNRIVIDDLWFLLKLHVKYVAGFIWPRVCFVFSKFFLKFSISLFEKKRAGQLV